MECASQVRCQESGEVLELGGWEDLLPEEPHIQNVGHRTSQVQGWRTRVQSFRSEGCKLKVSEKAVPAVAGPWVQPWPWDIEVQH